MQIIENISGALADDLEIVRSTARDLDLAVWLVGGPVRDSLLGRAVRDLDFLVEERVEEIAEAVAERLGCSVRLHGAFMTAKVLEQSGRAIDFTTARVEMYPTPGSLPVVRRATAAEDLLRRDFSINAIAWDLRDATLLDPADGRRDLELRLIRILHDASFTDDPTRIFRALRLAARLDFELERHTANRLQEALSAGALSTVTPHRVWREVVLCMHEPDPAAAFHELLRHNVIQSWTHATGRDAELEARLSRLSSMREDIAELDLEVLYLATLLAGLESASIPHGLPFSRRRFELLESLLRNSDSLLDIWMRSETEIERARLCLKLKPEEIVAIALRHDEPRNILDTCRELRATSLPFAGEDLEVPPGPHIGRALEDAVIESWINGGTRDGLLAFARRSALRYLKEQ